MMTTLHEQFPNGFRLMPGEPSGDSKLPQSDALDIGSHLAALAQCEQGWAAVAFPRTCGATLREPLEKKAPSPGPFA